MKERWMVDGGWLSARRRGPGARGCGHPPPTNHHPPFRGPAARGTHGGALLAVLWLSAALSVIVFSVAATTRAELERAGAAVDSARAYYLAEGAIERFLFHLSGYSVPQPGAEGEGLRFRPGQSRLRWDFPGGVVDLEITGESGKLNLISAPPRALLGLFLQLGVDPGRAEQIVAGIDARRRPENLAAASSFSSPQPSFLQLEDLLSIPGMTPEIYYGWWERDEDGRLAERGGVSRYLTMQEGGFLNANYAAPVVMRATGVPEGAIPALLQARESRLGIDPQRLAAMGLGALPGGLQLGAGGSQAYTVRATAQPTGRNVRRTVAALVRLGRNRFEPPLGVVQWYPTAN